MTKGRLSLTVLAILVAASLGFVAGLGWRDGQPTTGGASSPVPTIGPGASPSTSGAVDSARPGSPTASPPSATSPPTSVPGEAALPRTIDPNAYVAPPLFAPLREFDSGLRRRVVPTGLDWLSQSGSAPPLLYAPPGASATDWRLSRPDQHAVRGYGGDVSVAPGDDLNLHLAGSDAMARIDIFRMGLRDAHHVETIRNVALTVQLDGSPDPLTGRIEDHWPVSYTLSVGASWRPGVYLAKLTGSSGGQSYVVFVVRDPRPKPLMVVLPILTYEAYNDQGGANLYAWDGGPRSRAYEVSFDRPFSRQFGAGLFFWLDFPLIVWLEDHGYDPGYVTDLDIARNPHLAEGVETLVFAGHGEYWTGGLRDTVESRADHGTNLVFFGANQAFWQIRLGPDGLGTPDRTIVAYKDASLDPLTKLSPTGATVQFADPLVGRPPSSLMGSKYAGIVSAVGPMVVGPGISTFAPDVGLYPGELLPGLIGGEVDGPSDPFTGLLLGETSVLVGPDQLPANSAATIWINASGGRVFDAGTFGFAWGLDPRYAAAAPGFPASAFDNLTARILAWAGTQPNPLVVALLSAKDRYEAVAGAFPRAAGAIGDAERLTSLGLPGFVVEEEAVGSRNPFQVEKEYRTRAAAAAAVRRLAAAHLAGRVEIDQGPER